MGWGTGGLVAQPLRKRIPTRENRSAADMNGARALGRTKVKARRRSKPVVGLASLKPKALSRIHPDHRDTVTRPEPIVLLKALRPRRH